MLITDYELLMKAQEEDLFSSAKLCYLSIKNTKDLRYLEEIFKIYSTKSDNTDWYHALASNPITTLELLEKIQHTEHIQTILAIIEHPNCSAEVIDKLSKKASLENPVNLHNLLCAIAKAPNATKEIRSRLAVFDCASVNFILAQRRDLERDELERLAFSKSEQVRASIANHPRTSEDLAVRMLLEDDSDFVLSVLAESKYIAADWFNIFLTKSDYVKKAVAKHPLMPMDKLSKLVLLEENRTAANSYSMIAANHEKVAALSPEAVNKIYFYPSVARVFVQNKNCSMEQILEFINNPDSEVDRNATLEYSVRISAMSELVKRNSDIVSFTQEEIERYSKKFKEKYGLKSEEQKSLWQKIKDWIKS